MANTLPNELRRLAKFDTSNVLGDEMRKAAAEIERLTRGINKLSRIIEGNYGMATVDRTDGRWYVYNVSGECNDDRHADTLLELVRKLGGSLDDQRETPNCSRP